MKKWWLALVEAERVCVCAVEDTAAAMIAPGSMDENTSSQLTTSPSQLPARCASVPTNGDAPVWLPTARRPGAPCTMLLPNAIVARWSSRILVTVQAVTMKRAEDEGWDVEVSHSGRQRSYQCTSRALEDRQQTAHTNKHSLPTTRHRRVATLRMSGVVFVRFGGKSNFERHSRIAK